MSKITIVVPNFNKAEYVSECLDSVKAQSFRDFECIVIDDGSTDDSVAIINQCIAGDSRFKLLTQDNHGLAYSRNRGIREASGEFILPLDSDDYIDATYVERAMKIFEICPTTTVYYGRWVFFGYNADKMNSTLGDLRFSTYRQLLNQNSIHCSCVFRRDDALACGLYDETMKAYEDWEFLIRLLADKPNVFYDKNPSLYYRQFETSMTSYGHAHYNEIYDYIRLKNKEIYIREMNKQ